MTIADTIDYDAQAELLFEHVRQTSPLVHHITNLVVTNDTANLTIGLGASPVMAYAPEEVGEMASLAQALLLNIGTLSASEVESMLIAGRAANAAGVPVVLDPVGAGATRFRTETALRLLADIQVAVLRGNRGEIGALVGSGAMRGVDAVGSEDPETVARAAFDQFGVTTAVTGAVDVVVGPDAVFRVANGSPLLSRITGSGCMATTAIAVAIAGAEVSTLAGFALPAALGLATYGRAAERAAAGTPGPATFRTRLLDEAAALGQSGISGLRIATG